MEDERQMRNVSEGLFQSHREMRKYEETREREHIV